MTFFIIQTTLKCIAFYSNRMPFDQNTFGGFVGMLVNGLTTGLTYLMITTTIASLFLSMGLFLQAFYLHYESMCRNINELIDKKMPEATKQFRLKSYLIETIHFHNQAKE